MVRAIGTCIDINAPPQRVWEVLIDFDAWREWNPFIPSITGKLEVGERLQITVSPPGMKSMEFKPTVFAVRPGKEIIWGGSFLLFVYRGDHALSLEPLPGGGTRFRQYERFGGPLVLFMGRVFKPTEQGYLQMNHAFKRRVEGNSGSWQGTTCTQ
ncbi:MAG: SRPBCC family protein [Chloroflexota bacterium]